MSTHGANPPVETPAKPNAEVDTPAAPGPRPTRDVVSIEDWCELIRRRCGITLRDAQISTLVSSVQQQMQANGISSQTTLFERLSGWPDESAEWSGFVERLLNHETSFFRHPASFEALRRHILPELRTSRSDTGTRVSLWSAGCSTGQEAYSLAMVAMADEDLAGEFVVWGGDISRAAIDIARKGRYSARAVAGMPPEFSKRFLREVATGGAPEYEVTDDLRQRVRFMAVNLFSDWNSSLTQDVIFCHNVLIYFAPAAITKLLAILAARLKPGGYMVLGPGEGPSERPPGVELATLPGVRAFKRTMQRSTDGYL